MAKCLRCGATAEWIEGRVPPKDKSRIEELEAENEALRKELSRCAGTAHAAAFTSDRGADHG